MLYYYSCLFIEKEKKEIPRLETIYIIDIDVNPYYICF